jgi:hypothetical protein
MPKRKIRTVEKEGTFDSELARSARRRPVDKHLRVRAKNVSGFGSAGKRSKKQKENALAGHKELLASFGRNDIICYTDGSCLGNPGPCGSGAAIFFPLPPTTFAEPLCEKYRAVRGTGCEKSFNEVPGSKSGKPKLNFHGEEGLHCRETFSRNYY